MGTEFCAKRKLQGGGCTVANGNGTSSSGIGALIGGFCAFCIAIYCLRVIIGCLRVRPELERFCCARRLAYACRLCTAV